MGIFKEVIKIYILRRIQRDRSAEVYDKKICYSWHKEKEF